MMEAIRDDIQVLMTRFPGFRFSPTDAELLDYYLKKKLQGQNDCTDLIIPELDTVKFDAWDLPGKAVTQSENEWFYFNSGVRKFAGYTRKTESGYWMQIGTERLIWLNPSSNYPLGVKRTLVFFTGIAPEGVKTSWIMHELSMIDHPKDSMSVCRLLKNTDSNLKDPNRMSIFSPQWEYPNTEFGVQMGPEDSYENEKFNFLDTPLLEGELRLPSYPDIEFDNTESSLAAQMFPEDSYDQAFNRTIEMETIRFFDTHTDKGELQIDCNREWARMPSYPVQIDDAGGERLIKMIRGIRKETGKEKKKKKKFILLMEKLKEIKELRGNSHQEKGE